MRIWNRILQYSVYRKMFVSYALLVFIFVFLVSLALFSLFSSSAASEISNNSKAMLAQTSYTSDIVYDQVFTISGQLQNNNDIIAAMYGRELDPLIKYKVVNMLTSIQNVYPFIKYIGIYNGLNGCYINSLGLPGEDATIIGKSSKIYMDFIPRKLQVKYLNNGNPYNLLTFVVYPDFLLKTSTDAAIVISVDEKYIQNLINGLDNSSGFTTFVMDPEGTILSHVDSDMFLKNVSGESYVQKIFKSGEGQGSFVQNIDNKKQLITYVKSRRLNWFFVSVKPYNHLLKNIYRLRNITVAISLILFISGILVSVGITSTLYNPLKSLIEKVIPANQSSSRIRRLDEYRLITETIFKTQEYANSMKVSVNKSLKILKENCLLNLLKGNLSEIKVSDETIKNAVNQLKGPYFRVFTFKIDNFQDFKENNSHEDQILYRFVVCNIAQELLEKHCMNDTIVTEEDEIVALAQFEKSVPDENIVLTLMEIQDAIKEYFKFTVSIGIGDMVKYISNIHKSYKSSVEYIKYRLFFGYECIIDYEKIKERPSKPVTYPYAAEKNLIESLQLGNSKSILKRIDEFIKEVSALPCYQAINYSNQLMITLFKHFENVIVLSDQSFKDYFKIIDQINESETIKDISSRIQEFCDRICLLQSERLNKINAQKNTKVVEQVRAYLEAHYNNPVLSLNLVADMVNLSPGYLGKLFKSITDIPFNNYLNEIRLEKAKELLSTTDIPASEICEKIGILNVTYFSTLFKKTYGISPSQYREQSMINK